MLAGNLTSPAISICVHCHSSDDRLDNVNTLEPSPRRSTGATSSPHVTHRSTVNRHHDQPLELLGDGRWRFGPLDQATVGAGAPV